MSHCFISYSNRDTEDFGAQLANELEGGNPFIEAWFDKRDIPAGSKWDEKVPHAIQACKCIIFALTKDSVAEGSICGDELDLALRYKKPILIIGLQKDVEPPFRLGEVQQIDFLENKKAGLAKLRLAIQRIDSPEGQLDALKARFSAAERDLKNAKTEEEKQRIELDIDGLTKDIQAQQKIVDNPEAAAEQTQKNIEAGLERERMPEKPTAAQTSTKFINPPPGIAPNYFQDRQVETEQVVKFLQDDSQRLMTIVGRGGVGKTAMVCRLLKSLEGGELPDGLGNMRVEGIVYLSESGSHRVNFANLFYDLCKLLPADAAAELDAAYRNPQASTASKMSALLDRFTAGNAVLLLDNVEPLISVETFDIADAELDESLRTLLGGAHSTLKVILTTRVAPRGLNLYEFGKQRKLELDSGLEQKYAVEMLREMDVDGKLGLKSADPEVLKRAYERTLGFPRALEALFAILASDRYTTLDELLDMPTPVNVVEALVGEAFNRLDTNAQKVMQALAVYNRPVTPAAVDYLLTPHIPAMDSAPILQRLANMHFVRRSEGKYRLHQVDQEFAFNLIPKGSQTDWLTTGNQSQNNLMMYFFGKLLAAKPELIEKIKQGDQQAISAEFAELIKNLEPTERELFEEARKGILELNPELLEKAKSQDIAQDKEFISKFQDSLKQVKVSAKWSQYALLFRAADYFRQARKPRAEWKKLDDLSAQLAEFDLRCAAGDYDTACSVLGSIDFDYLLLWGHCRLLIDLHMRLKDKITDNNLRIINFNGLGFSNFNIGKANESIDFYKQCLNTARKANIRAWEGVSLGNLGTAYATLGDTRKAIEFYGQALVIAREIGDTQSEGRTLGNLGNVYNDLGNEQKAIESYEQRIVIARNLGDRRGEENVLICLGISYSNLGEHGKSLKFYQQALTIIEDIGDRRNEAYTYNALGSTQFDLGNLKFSIKNFKAAIEISDEVSLPVIQNSSRCGLAEAYLFKDDLVNARATIEAALQFDVPQYNHNASALHGIIALRQGDEVAAREAFVRAIEQADEILSKTAEYYDALDAKGLALCGLALTTGDSHLKDDCHLQAIETFRTARKIAPHAGIVKSVLRLFDELVKCDTDGILKDVRSAVEGKE